MTEQYKIISNDDNGVLRLLDYESGVIALEWFPVDGPPASIKLDRLEIERLQIALKVARQEG